MPSAVNAVEMGRRIRRERTRRGLTMAQLGERIGTSAAFVGYMEHGEKLPSLETLARVSQCLGVRMDYLVTGDTSACDRRQCRLLNDLEKWVEEHAVEERG